MRWDVQVWEVWYGVEDVAFRVSDSGRKGVGFEVQGSRFRGKVQGSGFRVQGSGFRVQGSGFWVLGSGFKG
jgi:hypothetical protein